jgi:tRNA G18 (ribose-2'-O)-methylase SpoU
MPECLGALEATNYAPYAVARSAQAQKLGLAKFPTRSAFIVGNERSGLSFNPADYPAVIPLEITQFGSVESLNVAVAASLVAFEYVRQHAIAKA